MKDGVTPVSELGPEATILVETSDSVGITSIRCDSMADGRIHGLAIVDASPLPVNEDTDAAIGVVSSNAQIKNNIIHHLKRGIWVTGEPRYSGTSGS